MLHPYFPINKNLWTSTFVLFTGGFAMLVLAACYWVVDLRGWRKGITPILAFGRNAILAYALAALVSEISTDFEFHDSAGHLRTLHGWLYSRALFHSLCESTSMRRSAFAGVFFVALIFNILLPLLPSKEDVFIPCPSNLYGSRIRGTATRIAF